MVSFLFYFFSALALLSALLVITLSRPTRALLALILCMLSLTVLYLLLGAEFLAMVHLIVYAGAVLVLFLFVIMLLGIGAKDIPLFSRFRFSYLILALLSSVLFLPFILIAFQSLPGPQTVFPTGTLAAVGKALFSDYLLPFELTSLLLLIGVFSAVGLAKKESAEGETRQQGRSCE
ncbi:MAG: NADH-quinone oxidoreductase subunit J [Candidatus Omnitrophica bacterium]|nr:NADH-quinone oxidoreductase subunit J [Candidatus Omnitrophota bacterium]